MSPYIQNEKLNILFCGPRILKVALQQAKNLSIIAFHIVVFRDYRWKTFVIIVSRIVLIFFSGVFWRVRNTLHTKWQQLLLKYMKDWMEKPCKLSKKENWEIHIDVLIKRYNCFCIIAFFELVHYLQERNISSHLTWNNCRCLIFSPCRDKNIFDQTKLYRIEVLLHVISAAYNLKNRNVYFYEILGLHDDEDSYCALVDYYTLQPGGWVRKFRKNCPLS